MRRSLRILGSSVVVPAALALGLPAVARRTAAPDSFALPGQQPGPEIFAPGIISGPANDLSPAFSPDGRTVLFTRGNGVESTILASHLSRGGWSRPEIASFSGVWRDLEPTMAPDGSYLVFVSNRPPTGDGKPLDGLYNGATQPAKGGNLWRVDRTSHGWSEPRRLSDVVNASGSIFAPSVAADGSIYFMQPVGAQSRFHIFRAQLSRGAFMTPVAVPVSAGEGIGDFDPAVAPDESFMVFSSARLPANGTSLFIAFRRNGTWDTPTYLGEATSMPGANNIEARLGPDFRALYFSSTRVAPALQGGRDAGRRSLERMDAWNNGLANIWRVSLNQWLGSEVSR